MASSLSFNFLLKVGPPSGVGSWPTLLRVLHIPGGCHQISAISNIQEITSLKLVGSSQLLWISIGIHPSTPANTINQSLTEKILLIAKTRVLELTLKICQLYKFYRNIYFLYFTFSFSITLDIQTPAEKVFGPPKYTQNTFLGGMTGCLGLSTKKASLLM